MRHLRSAGIGATLVLLGTTSLQNAVANGDTRTLTFHHTHSGEDGTFTFKKDGRYDPEVLDKLNQFLRDWRNQKSTRMDPHLFDIVWEVYRETDARAPVQIVSSYRSPETNSMLRARSNGVAKFSQHMLGRAMDFYIPGVKLADLRAAGLRLQRGGVGFYPTSGSPFVHMDTGNVRHWPRMTHDELARVFPDGKTVHVPSDGRPLANYEAALAEVRTQNSDAGVAMASAGSGKGFLAKLFGRKDDEEEAGSGETVVAAAESGASRADAKPASGTASRTASRTAAAPMPVPAPRPGEVAAGVLATAQLAAPLPLQRPAEIMPGRDPAAGRTQMASNQPATTQIAGARGVTPQGVTQSVTLAAAPLPAVITRGLTGSAGASEAQPSPALGYASAGDPRDLDADVRGATFGAVEKPADGSPSAVAALARLRSRSGKAAPAPLPAAPSAARGRTQAEAQIAFDSLFLAPSLDSALFLREPELRIFAGFLTAPREVVAMGFSRDAGFGLKTARFAGPAVAELPTFVSAPRPSPSGCRATPGLIRPRPQTMMPSACR